MTTRILNFLPEHRRCGYHFIATTVIITILLTACTDSNEPVEKINLSEMTEMDEVKMIDKVIDAASGTFGARLQIPTPGNKIPAGLRCEVLFSL